MVPIEELLKNEIVKVSFAEVAEYLLQVIAEKNGKGRTPSSTSSESTALPPENKED
jgi:hypothetical protein